MASRRDYERTAAILNFHVKAQDNQNEIAQNVLHGVANEFAAAFKIDNPRFNNSLFFRACGFTEGEK